MLLTAGAARADELPVTVPEDGSVGVSLRGSFQRADDRFESGGDRVSVDEGFDELGAGEHSGWESDSIVGELALDWSPGGGWQFLVSAPLVRNRTEGQVAFDDSVVAEEFSATGLGDMTVAVALTQRRESLYRDDAVFEPIVVRSQLFAHLPTGSDPSFADGELGTGDGRFAVGLLFDGYQRIGCGDLAAALGYTWREDERVRGGVFQGELGVGWWPWHSLRLSVSLLAHTYEGEALGLAYGALPEVPADDGRQTLLSVAPALSFVRDDFYVSLAARAPRTGDGLSRLDSGIPLLGKRALAPSIPPLSLSVGARLF